MFEKIKNMDASLRFRRGWMWLISGSIILTLGIIWVHYAGLPETELIDGVSVAVVVDYLNWVPRGWFSKSVGYLVAFGGSQLMLGGAWLAYVVGRPMTWALASFAAFLAWIQLVMLFGIVPSEWLNLSQTDLNWSPQRVALVVPSWLMLGNEVEISYAALKDSISGIYNLGILVGIGWVVFRWQQPKKKTAPTPSGPKMSSYGRPLTESKS